jgi:hypothetical protein
VSVIVLPLYPGDRAAARFWPAGNSAVRVAVRAELTIGAEELTAALYEYTFCPPDALGTETAGKMIAAELAVASLDGLHQRAAVIAAAEKADTLAEPGWLATCRQYVHDMLTGAQTDTPEAARLWTP